MIGSQPLESERPRILYFIVRYPNFSETYMHEEIRSLIDQYDIKIVTYKLSQFPRREPFPYEVIEYEDSELVYGRIEKVDLNFQSPLQREFLKKIDSVISEFKPHIIHAHYFGMGLLLRALAERHNIPFTIRTHSMDILSEPAEKIDALCQAANNPLCLKVLTFPAFRERLMDSGLRPDKVESCWPVINFARFYKPERRASTKRVLCAGPAIKKKAHAHFIDLAAMMRGSGFAFDLYARGLEMDKTVKHNEEAGNPVEIKYADPDDMPDVYPKYDWLVYPSSVKINKVGFPTAIPEAQASGIGVCWQELPGRRGEQLEFLGGAGFLFQSIQELPEILKQGYPEQMRLLGLENAKKCDIERHKHLLTDTWAEVIR